VQGSTGRPRRRPRERTTRPHARRPRRRRAPREANALARDVKVLALGVDELELIIRALDHLRDSRSYAASCCASTSGGSAKGSPSRLPTVTDGKPYGGGSEPWPPPRPQLTVVPRSGTGFASRQLTQGLRRSQREGAGTTPTPGNARAGSNGGLEQSRDHHRWARRTAPPPSFPLDGRSGVSPVRGNIAVPRRFRRSGSRGTACLEQCWAYGSGARGVVALPRCGAAPHFFE
jgi:hypothetical protein